MRPIGDARDVPMLHRIEMDIIDMALKIRVIANGMFPIAPLPDTFLSFADFACGPRHWIKTSRKAALDQAPTYREIVIALRQRPKRVDVIGQDANGDSFKLATLLDCPIDLSQTVNLIEQQVARPFGENDREEECAAFDFGSYVSRHDASYHAALWWARRKERLCPPYEVAL